MAIFAYCGLPGAGKSYEVVRGPIMKASSKGRTVWTNIPVKDLPGVEVVAGPKATEHWYLDAPAGSMIVIDECWRYWGAGKTADEIPEDIREWFAMHRHRTADGTSTDIVLVCQDLSQIAKFVRELVERTYRCYKLSALGMRTRYRVDAYDGAVGGQKPPKTQLIGSWHGKYEPAVYKHYQSHTQGGVATEVAPDSRGSVWRTPAVIAIPIALILVPALAFNLDFTGQDEKRTPAVAQQEAPVPAEPAPVVVVERETRSVVLDPDDEEEIDQVDTPDMSTQWTLIGVIQRDDGSGVALVRSSLGSRRLIIERDCSKQDADEWVCTLDGRHVTGWSGAQWRTIARVDPMR